jgi:alkylation response protein AidB-like acyl-CoA dehydrogenase
MADGNSVSAADDVHAKIRALAPAVDAALPRMDRECRLSPEVIDGMIASGLFRSSVPKTYGGLELDPMSQVRIIEECARLDGSVGWIAMIGVVGGHLAALVAPKVARELFARDDAVFAGQGFLTGKHADAVPGGWRVSGRFTFASGICHARTVFCSATLHKDGRPLLSEGGAPQTRLLLVPVSKAKVIETWDTIGMRATGSHDFELEDVVVPDEYTVNLAARPTVDTPSYQSPALVVTYQAGVPLGIARGALDAARKLCKTKRVLPGNTLLQDDPRVQECIGWAETTLAAARNHTFAMLEDAWATLCKREKMTLEQRANCRMMVIYAHEVGKKVVQRIVDLAATSSIIHHSVFDRALRDITTAAQHRQVHTRLYNAGGRAYLGLPQEYPWF